MSQLDDACRAKEAQRVDLELRLTQVQGNLKKSLAGGTLGASVEAKPPVKVYLLLKYMLIPACMHIFHFYLFCFCVDLQEKDAKYLQ